MRLKILYVNESKGKLTVETIPLTKINEAIRNNGNLKVPKLSSSKGLKVEMLYDTDKNKEPSNIVRITFERISFTENGECDLRANYGELNVKVTFALPGLSDSPLPVPIAPQLPTNEEVKIIKEYLKNKFPQLLSNPYVIEEFVLKLKHSHQEDIKAFKKSHM